MKINFGKYICATSFIGFFCLSPEPVFSNPSSIFEEKLECIENPDFVTPKDKTFKYCIKSNGLVKKIDNEGVLSEEIGQLNKTVEDKTRKGLTGAAKLLW